MIRLDNISKQNGHQILFIEASMGIQKGEKVGLVGPNGAGKTTLFRMITGQEEPDDGLVAIDPGMTIGYFSQDVGEMSGQSSGRCGDGRRWSRQRAGCRNGQAQGGHGRSGPGRGSYRARVLDRGRLFLRQTPSTRLRWRPDRCSIEFTRMPT